METNWRQQKLQELHVLLATDPMIKENVKRLALLKSRFTTFSAIINNDGTMKPGELKWTNTEAEEQYDKLRDLNRRHTEAIAEKFLLDNHFPDVQQLMEKLRNETSY